MVVVGAGGAEGGWQGGESPTLAQHPPPPRSLLCTHSNASDALDKVRLLAVQNPDEYKTGSREKGGGRRVRVGGGEKGWGGGGRARCVSLRRAALANAAMPRCAPRHPPPPRPRARAHTHAHTQPPHADLEVRIRADKEAHTVTIEDTGARLGGGVGGRLDCFLALRTCLSAPPPR